MDRYQSLTENYYKKASVIIVVFSKSCSESFRFITPLMNDINRIDCCPNSLFFLVGNKVDLKEKVHDNQVNDFVQSETWPFQKYMKTSAKTGAGVNELLNEIARSLIANKMMPVQEKYDLQSLASNRKTRKSSCCN